MSAHPIAEPHFGHRPDVEPIVVDAKKLHDTGEGGGKQTSKVQSVARPGPGVVGNESAVNPWVMSRARSCLDRVVAAFVLALLLPAMLVIVLMVRLSSRGPALFCQRRAGRNREEFILYKFRSMRAEDPEGPAITVSGDDRITRVGTFLRRYKLDELPQFWNVLKGNMSLVGPRPKLPHHEGLDLPYRPGITGIATLAFREEEKILAGIPREQLDAFYEICIKPRKAELDLEYMRDATLGSDLKLLWRTCSSCLFGPDELSTAESERLSLLVVDWLDLSLEMDETVPSSSEVGVI
jgi:lipopolysaccharide/colanic/teichoic acid biosynthesis glycosyltransferase